MAYNLVYIILDPADTKIYRPIYMVLADILVHNGKKGIAEKAPTNVW